MKNKAESKFEIVEYRDGFGSYYVIAENGRTQCFDLTTNPNERMRTKAEAKKALAAAKREAK